MTPDRVAMKNSFALPLRHQITLAAAHKIRDTKTKAWNSDRRRRFIGTNCTADQSIGGAIRNVVPIVAHLGSGRAPARYLRLPQGRRVVLSYGQRGKP